MDISTQTPDTDNAGVGSLNEYLRNELDISLGVCLFLFSGMNLCDEERKWKK